MFSKKDLDSGNVVEIRNGARFLYHNIDRDKILDIRGYNYLKLTNYDENFNCMTGTSPIFDIVKVYRDYTCQEVLWERKKKPELTDVEKTIKLKATYAIDHTIFDVHYRNARVLVFDENHNLITNEKLVHMLFSTYKLLQNYELIEWATDYCFRENERINTLIIFAKKIK